VIELWTGLICGCVPALRPFLNYLPDLPSRFSITSLSRRSHEKKSHESSSNGSSSANSRQHNGSDKHGISWFKGSKGSEASTKRSDLTSSTDGTYIEL
ncbi:MAG: hypothetical protein M1835_003245, partial [Candelina submexicana]